MNTQVGKESKATLELAKLVVIKAEAWIKMAIMTVVSLGLVVRMMMWERLNLGENQNPEGNHLPG